MRDVKKYVGFDLTVLAPEHKPVILEALRATEFPTTRIYRRTGRYVPVTVSDLSRYAEDVANATGHAHVHEGDEKGHILGEPGGRRAALGLYWLPTSAHPAGRVEVGLAAMANPDLAREVFLAEAAHAVDYGALTSSQRERIEALFDYSGAGTAPAGWFEEEGEQGYWRWRGERWMGLFMAAFAPTLSRPLEARQPWEWSYDASDIAAVRRIVRRPQS